MLDEEEEDNGFFILVLGVVAGVLLLVTVIALGGDDLPEATISGDAPEEVEEEVVEEEPEVEEVEEEPEPEPEPEPEEEPVVEAAFTMWDALNQSGEAGQFALIGGALGLQADLEALEDADGNPIQRTLFAPSDSALNDLGTEAVGAIAGDPEGANALVGYHFIDEILTAEDLIALDGQTITTRTGLPIAVTVVDGAVVLNGSSTVTSADFGGDNGVVHIVDTVLQPPTLNEVLALDNIEFDTASATVTAAGQATLQIAADFFEANPTVNAAIEGHTDTDGADDANQALSQARADAVLAFLVDSGLDATRFTATGFGETQPILVDGVEDKDASRRIEFVAR